MGALASYALQSALILLAEYVVYKWLLAPATFHRTNRAILLACYLAAALLPLAPLGGRGAQAAMQVTLGTPQFAVESAAEAGDRAGWFNLLPLLYVAGMVLSLALTLIAAVRVARLLARGKRCCHNGVAYLQVSAAISPFSFMNRIAIPAGMAGDELRLALTHEATHVRCRHFADLVVARLFVAFNWFNPAAYLMCRELKSVHEYEVDSAVVATERDPRLYQMLLIKTTVGQAFHSITNSLNHSQIKNRLTMMMKSKSRPVRLLAATALLPAVALAIASTNCPAMASVIERLDNSSVALLTTGKSSKLDETAQLPAAVSLEKAIESERADSTVVEVPEEMPLYKDGLISLYKELANNLKYPQEAINAGVSGRVLVRMVVRKDGTLGDVEVIHSSNHPALDSEALRVVKECLNGGWMPGRSKGEPVNCRFTIPVNFKLPEKVD